MLLSRSRPEPGAVKSQGLKLLCAGVCLGANWALLFEAYKLAGVSMATLMDYCAPVIVLLLSPLLLRQKQGARAYIGMAAAVFGLVLALGIGGVHITGTALAVGLAAAVFYAGLIILNQMTKGLQRPAAHGRRACNSGGGHAVLCPAQGREHRLPGNEGGTAALLVLCTVNTALACYLYFSSMNRLRARTVALLGYIDPVSALVFAAVFLNESMTALQIFGAALVLAGAAYGQSGGKERL